MPTVSTFGAQLGTEGVLIQANIGSPAAFMTIANAFDWTMPTKANTVETTNFGDSWVRRFPTLLDMGNIQFKVYFLPLEPTHNNTAASTTTGLRYLMLNRILTNFKIVYPDGSASSDTFPAYVTDVSITGKVGGVFEGAITLSNNGAPTLA
jgi:hypothetical protein